MDLKLFLSTFFLIFLAELGDKTQLAAMAKSTEGRLTVFLAASSALVLSTLIAVAFGSALTKIVPESAIKIASGALFVVFGILILKSVVAPKAAEAAPEAELGPVMRFVLNQAVAFEEAAEADYLRLAATHVGHGVQPLLLALAEEERRHVDRLRQLGGAKTEAPQAPVETGLELPELVDLIHDVSDQGRPVVEHAVEHELATADFYAKLADSAHFGSLRAVFGRLAEEERAHARRLRRTLEAATPATSRAEPAESV